MFYTSATLNIHVLRINASFPFTGQLTCPSSDLGELSSGYGGNLMAVVIHTSATPLKLVPKATEFVSCGWGGNREFLSKVSSVPQCLVVPFTCC